MTAVIDPTVWVKEKLSVALSAGPDVGETPLRRLIAALRSIHAELMRRPARDRVWVSALAAVFQAGDGVLVSAGDCECFRYREGLLSRLKRQGEDTRAGEAPRGALGSEPQVRIEVVPLRTRPGDLYVASTRQLREGELAALARDLASARDGAELLRAGVEGASDRGRLAIRMLESEEDSTLPARAESLWRPPAAPSAPDAASGAASVSSAIAPTTQPIPPTPSPAAPPSIPAADPKQVSSLADLPLLPDEILGEPEEELVGGGPGAGDSVPDTAGPPGVPGALIAPEATTSRLSEVGGAQGNAPAAPAMAQALQTPGHEQALSESQSFESAPEDSGEALPARPPVGVGDEIPWYETFAIWGGGALAIIALALLIRAILPGMLGRETKPGTTTAPIAATGLVDFLSDPPGAAVRVDGEWLDGKTPLPGVALDPGRHRIELDWGPSGTWRDTLEVTSGARVVIHPAIFGAVSFRSSDPSRSLDVYVDGTYAGATPLRVERVVVGRHLVRFGGSGASSTSQEVDVLRDAPVEIVGNAGPVPETGRLTIRSALLTDAGFEAGRNDPVWIDGIARGATPLSLPLKPGTHSVRVVRRNFPAQVTVVDVKAGGDHYVTAEFGARSEQPLQFQPPDAISISNPLPVTVALPPDEWDPSVAVWLYAAAPDGSFQAKRMTKLEGGDRVFATLIPSEVLRNNARRVRVYFKAAGSDGRELYSEIVTVRVRD